jgi:hypothetical protein
MLSKLRMVGNVPTVLLTLKVLLANLNAVGEVVLGRHLGTGC